MYLPPIYYSITAMTIARADFRKMIEHDEQQLFRRVAPSVNDTSDTVHVGL